MPHVAVRYEAWEMEEVLNKNPFSVLPETGQPDRELYSHVDWLAGEGPQRPIVIELHGLRMVGELNIRHRLPRTVEETYWLTYRGHLHNDSLKPIFQGPEFYGRTVIVGGDGIVDRT